MKNINIPKDKINNFCRKWKIKEFALFGSVLQDNFGADSDIDVLVEFESGIKWRWSDLCDMNDEIEDIFGRKVDLVEKRLVLQSDNPYRKKHILENMEVLHVA
jgi:predicted nucleotidyltransferase